MTQCQTVEHPIWSKCRQLLPSLSHSGLGDCYLINANALFLSLSLSSFFLSHSHFQSPSPALSLSFFFKLSPFFFSLTDGTGKFSVSDAPSPCLFYSVMKDIKIL